MQIEPRVQEIVENYAQGNLAQVYEYLTLEGMIVDPSTWAGRLKMMIEQHRYATAKNSIELIAYKLLNQLKTND